MLRLQVKVHRTCQWIMIIPNICDSITLEQIINHQWIHVHICWWFVELLPLLILTCGNSSKNINHLHGWWLNWLYMLMKLIAGWWFQPLWKIWNSVGMIIPNIRKNKFMFQTTNQIHFPIGEASKFIHVIPHHHHLPSGSVLLSSVWTSVGMEPQPRIAQDTIE